MYDFKSFHNVQNLQISTTTVNDGVFFLSQSTAESSYTLPTHSLKKILPDRRKT